MELKVKNPRVVIVQCRLSSSRLPEKALLNLQNKSVLSWCLSSMSKIPAQKYFVATDKDSYEKILPICKECGFEIFVGSLENVLNRFVSLIKKLNEQNEQDWTIIRATADNPFLFYEAAIQSVEEFEKINSNTKNCDYLTFTGLPHGSGVEIFSSSSLIKASGLTTNPYDTEHVGPSLYNHQDKFNCKFQICPKEFDFPNLRTTIDTFDDFLRAVCCVNFLKNENSPFTSKKIIEAFSNQKVLNPVILIPSVQKGFGTGHLRRCINLSKQNDFFIYIPKDKTLCETDFLLNEEFENGLNKDLIINQLPINIENFVIITDLFKTSKEFYEKISNSKLLIGLDEGNEKNSQNFDFLLDIIPSYNLQRKPNFFEPKFIEISQNKKINQNKEEIKKILVCFGGEDPKNFTIPVVKVLCKKYPFAKITAVLNKNIELVSRIPDLKEKRVIANEKKQSYFNDNVEIVSQIPNLKDKIFEYDLVITHYGLTCFEAVNSGCKVILLAPTLLHKKLAQKYGFCYIKDKKITEKSFEKLVNKKNLLPNLNNYFNKEKNEKDFSDFLQNVTKGQKYCCPICQKKSQNDKIISRTEKKTYRRCKKCGVIYISFSTIEEKIYQKTYFFEEYKNQYGKTYEEDFNSIKLQCDKRIGVISSLIKSSKQKSIFDIGCAYGPFLKSSSEKNFIPYGIDPCIDAIDYVQKKLNFFAKVAFFPDFDTKNEFNIEKFDVVTMWYVIEHFKDLRTVLQKINQILQINGIFAFSTPCANGISGSSNKNQFFINSPSDHYSVWEIKKAKKILKKFGFKIEKIVSTGHHPERFIYVQKNNIEKDSKKWKFIEKFSKIKKLGDTMEIYCRKIK